MRARRVLGGGAAALVVVCALVGLQAPVAAQDSVADGAAEQLAERFAPVLALKAQDGECDGEGERFAPMSVEGLLGNPQVLLRQVGTGNPVVGAGATARDLFGLGEGFYLDFPGDALDPGCVYERDYRRYTAGEAARVYAHIVASPGEDRLALQYWFFWYYNDWNNKHEGDWEGIQLLFDVGTVDEALATDPVSVGYAQHEGGERADWGDDKLELRGSRPVVYSSVGSHASYFGSALYLGRSGSEGFGCDNTDGPSLVVEPAVTVLPDGVSDPDDPLAWLAYEGRWGERQSGPFNGPTGPTQKARWFEPFEWHDDLRDASVVVPAGDRGAGDLVAAFCGVVEWGSAQLIVLEQNPVGLVIAVVAAFVVASVALGRTDWSLVAPLPVVRRRRFGQIMKASAHLYRSTPAPFLTLGIAYIPVALLTGLGVALVQFVPLAGALVESDRDLGVIGALITLAVGSLGYAAAFMFVTAATALLMHSFEEGPALSGREALRAAATHVGALAAAAARVVVIVGVLLATVVGIPWAIRQLFRYQFMAQATVLESQRGRAALDRSSELVAGRWFHTAAALALVNAFVGAVAAGVGIVLLLVLSDLPLWLFSIVVTASSALIVPYSAIAAVMLYGDAVAEARDAEAADELVQA